MNRFARTVALGALVAAAIAGFRKRPVRRPADAGRWDPVERGASRRR